MPPRARTRGPIGVEEAGPSKKLYKTRTAAAAAEAAARQLRSAAAEGEGGGEEAQGEDGAVQQQAADHGEGGVVMLPVMNIYRYWSPEKSNLISQNNQKVVLKYQG